MSNEQLLKRICRLLLQALRETPGGMASLGRLSLRQPDLLAEITALSSNIKEEKNG